MHLSIRCEVLVGWCITAVFGHAAVAQSFNIDMGNAFGTPSDAYGAAAGQAGSWNDVSFTGFAVPLNNLDGSGSAVTAQVDGTAGPFSFDNPGTAGDDHALMDDLFDVGGVGGTGSVTIAGLAAGTYDVYTYAWAPDSDTFLTSVIVGGSALTSGGAWPGVHQSGITYAQHTTTVGEGANLVINVATSSGFGNLNGVQVVGGAAPAGWSCDGLSCALVAGGAYETQALCDANCASDCPCPESLPATCAFNESPPAMPSAAPCSSCAGGCGPGLPDGLSVYPHSGQAVESATDLRIPGRGQEFAVKRVHRTRMGSDSGLGNGWDEAYNVRFEPCGPDRMIHGGNSRRDRYVLQPDGTWKCDEFFNVLRQETDGSYRLQFSDKGEWRLHALDGTPNAGKLSQIVDRNGETLSLHYDGSGRLSQIDDTLQRPITFEYDGAGRRTLVSDFAGREVRYEYYDGVEPGGSLGDLKSVTTPSVISTPEFPVPPGHEYPMGKTTRYTYTRGFSDPRLNHMLETTTDAKSQTYLTNVYAHTIDASDFRHTTDPGNLYYGRAVRQIHGDAGDIIDYVYVTKVPTPANNFAVLKTIVNDRVGNVKEYCYNAENRLVIQREYTGRAIPGLPTTETENRPTGQLRPDDPPFFETRYEYNSDALVTRIVYPNGNETVNIYEGDITPSAPQRIRGNRREVHRLPGPLGGDQAELVEYFEYDADVGCGGCGTNFVTRHEDARGNVTRYEYDSAGNRTRTIHAITGIEEQFEYNLEGQMTAHVLPDNGSDHLRRDEMFYYASGPQRGYVEREVEDAGGLNLTTTYEYDLVGNVTRRIDPRGHDDRHTYNQLNQVVFQESRELNDGGVRYQTESFYDANDNVVRIDVQNVDETGFDSASNPVFTTIYEFGDVLNYVTRICDEKGAYDVPAGQMNCSDLPEDQFVVTEIEYDDNRNEALARSGEAVIGNQPTNVTRTLYDERDKLFREIRAEGDPDASTTQLDYDLNGNLKRQREGLEDDPRVTIYAYDGYDRRTRATDPMGNVTQYHYDANGNTGGEQGPGMMNPFGVRTMGELDDVAGSAANIRLSQIQYEYDPMDRRTRAVIEHFDPATQAPIGDGQSVTVTTYSDASEVTSETDDNGHTTTTTYDTAGRVLRVTDAMGNTWTNAYDANDNVIMVTEVDVSDTGQPDQTFITTFTFDNLDRTIRKVDNAGQVTQYFHDSRDNRTVVIDALRPTPNDPGNVTRYVYDGMERLIRTERMLTSDGTGTGAPVGSIVTTMAYDDNSRLVGQTDDAGNTTTYEYDALDRLVAETAADGTSQTHLYDVHDNIVMSLDANSTSVTSIFDAADRIIATTVTPGPGVSADTTAESFAYDGVSRRVLAIDDDATVVRAFDTMFNLTAETLNGQSTLTTYDGVGNPLTTTYPSGRTIVCTFDALDRKKTIADAAGPEGPAIAEFDYIGQSRVERRQFANNVRLTYQYDADQRIVRTTHTRDPNGTPALIDDRTYAWDRMSNKTARVDALFGGTTHTYTYDSIYRMTRSSRTLPGGSGGETSYMLDGVGNRQTITGTGSGSMPGAYFLDASDPPADADVNQYTATPFDRRQYDANGNLIRIAAAGDGDGDGDIDLVDFGAFQLCYMGTGMPVSVNCRLFDFDGDSDVDLVDFGAFQLAFGTDVPALRIKYDYRDQMVEYDDRGANRRHTYAYDALGRRIARRTNVDGDDAHTRYFYDDNQVVEEQDNTGLTRATYVYGLYVDEVLSMRAASTAEFFFHADDLHNVMVVTDSAGQVVERYDYADYGAPELSPYRQVSDAEELFDSSPHPSPTAVIQRIADDVTFDRPVTLHSIRWWGGYSYDPATPTSDNFTIRIHADAGGRPGTVLHQTAAGNGVARRTTGRIITSESGDTPEFEYEAALSAPFDAAAGQTYWLSLINDNGAHPARWGWASSPDGDGAIAYQHGAAPWAIAAGFNTAFILLMSESSIGNPYLFNGRRYDPETGWYYYRTRYLDPVIGRFTTRDTAGLWDDEAAMGNAFAYVGSNPWSYVDDDGQGKKKAQRKQRKAERKAKRAAKLEKKAEKKADKAKKAAAKGKNKKAEKLKKKSEKLHKKAEKKLKQAEKAWQQAKDEWDRIGAKKGVRGKGHFAADGSCGIQYEWFNPKGTQYAIFEKYKIKIKDRGFVGTLNISAATHNYEVNGSTFSDSYAPVYCGRNYKVTVWAMPYGGGDLKLGSALIKAPGHPALCYCD